MRYLRDTTRKLLPFRAQSFLPQDTQQIELFRQEQLHRQWAIETQLHQTLGTVAAEKQFHAAIQHELETYATELEQWVNTPGRSPEQQLYIEAQAKHLRDTFTQSVLERVEITRDHLTQTVSRRPQPLPEPPVIDVTPDPAPSRKPFWKRHILKLWFLWFLVSLWTISPVVHAVQARLGAGAGDMLTRAWVVTGAITFLLAMAIAARGRTDG
jgi:hypothetical protein